jgi:hypothetical protein
MGQGTPGPVDGAVRRPGAHPEYRPQFGEGRQVNLRGAQRHRHAVSGIEHPGR